jgi:7,8-dihydro-6-hydroxymethylpterin dimethyltransferase
VLHSEGKRRLGILAPVRPPLDVARDGARSLDERAARAHFAIADADRALKTTVSLCPECLAHVPALVFTHRGRVHIRKDCKVHGRSEAVLENDERFYFLSNKDRAGNVFAKDKVFDIPSFPSALQEAACCAEGETCDSPSDATDQMTNKTCTILVETTDACNLACPVCYSDAKGDRKLPRADFERYLDDLAQKKGGLDSVQLTGGEAMLHPDFWQMLEFVCAHPKIKKVYLPTNGILLAKADAAERLARHKAKLMVLLQFDGLSDRTDQDLRAATPARVRQKVVERLGELGVFMQLTMTLARGVNYHEVGDVIELALKHDHIKVVALQPATYSGRYDLEPSPMDRLTLSDVVKAVVRQTRRRAKEADFVPIPCSHPNCGWITLFLRRFGLVGNVVRYVDLPKIIDNVAYRTLLSTDELKSAVGTGGGSVIKRGIGRLAKGLVRSQDMFTVAIKPFMDRHSYDQDRVDNCCHHLLDTKGNPRSFCEYNAILRQQDPWTALPRLTD